MSLLVWSMGVARLLVFGNEKGGAGKSTLSMHVVCGLLHSGARVAILDLDLRQLTLLRFFENRADYMERHRIRLPLPNGADLSGLQNAKDADEQVSAFEVAIRDLSAGHDYIVVDCPGALTPLSQRAHQMADTLITPLNDSFVDFDLLARIEPETHKVKGPSIYAEMVWDARKTRALNGEKPIDWVVARNRLSALQMHNKRKLGEALVELSKRIGFRFVAGLSDRVVYRELFPLGLTLLDHQLVKTIPTKLSNIAARQEIRDLMISLELPDFKIGF